MALLLHEELARAHRALQARAGHAARLHKDQLRAHKLALEQHERRVQAHQAAWGEPDRGVAGGGDGGAAPGVRSPAGPAALLLRDLNAARSEVGLRALAEDPELSRACAAHCRFLVANPAKIRAGLSAHLQEPDLRCASPAGARAGLASSISYAKPSQVVPAWMATLYHRLPLLRPGLRAVGIGVAIPTDEDRAAGLPRGVRAVTVVDVQSACDAVRRPCSRVRAVGAARPQAAGASGQVEPVGGASAALTVVLCPARAARAVPAELVREVPDPLPVTAQGRPAGYPITMSFSLAARKSRQEPRRRHAKAGDTLGKGAH